MTLDTLAFTLLPRPHAPVLPTVDVGLVLNGQPLADGLVDVAALIGCATLPLSRFDLYTCGCGVAGCAGFHAPLVQRRQGDTVSWTTEDEKLSTVLGLADGRTLTFDAGAFDAAITTLYRDLLAFEQDGFVAASELPESYLDIGDTTPETQPLQERVERIQSAGRNEARLAVLVDAAIDPSLPKQVPFLWGNEPQQAAYVSPIDVENAVVILLDLRRGLATESEPKALAVAPLVALLQRFAQSLDVEEANTAFQPFAHFGFESACAQARSIHKDEPVFGPVFQEVDGVATLLGLW